MGGVGSGDAEQLREQRPPRQHHDADQRVVDARDGRNRATAIHSTESFFSSPV